MMAFLARLTLVVFAAGSLPALNGGPAAATPASGAVTAYTKWSATPYMSLLRYTVGQSVQIAQDFNLVIGQSYQFGTMIPQMKAANPKTVILEYMDAVYAQKTKSYAESLYAHDARGRRILSTKYHNYLMNISNPDWVKVVNTRCSKAPPFDGCFLDDLGDHLLNANFLTSLPINARTGKVWTAAEWLSATTAEAAAIVASNPGLVIAGNGLHDGRSYYDPIAPASQLYSALDFGLAETWLRQANMPVGQFKKESDWLLDVNMIIDAARRGKSMLVATKVWVSATSSQIFQWHAYSLATFMLATHGNAYYQFLAPFTPSSFIKSYPTFQVQLGSPLGAFYKGSDGVYHRSWTLGTVWVNPTANRYAMNITRTCTTLRGTVLTAPRTITVQPNSGDVCTY